MTAKVLFNSIGHFQTNYHSIDMNVIKFNTNKKRCFFFFFFFFCSMPKNPTISQFKYVKLLPVLVTMVTMKHFLLYQVHYRELLNDQPYLIRWITIKLKAGKWYLAGTFLPAFMNFCCHFVSMATNIFFFQKQVLNLIKVMLVFDSET